MRILRIVSNLPMSSSEASRSFYADFPGLEVQMDLGWIVTYAAPPYGTDSVAGQLDTLTADATAPMVADVTVEANDVDELYAEAVRRGLSIVYELTGEPWGARRFFVRDPAGNVINCMMHHRWHFLLTLPVDTSC